MQYELVLASESPRRKDLLTKAGFQFTVHPSKISEILKENLTIDAQILDIAREKAKASLNSLTPSQGPEKQAPRLILSADTLVILDGKPLGKPETEDEAFAMLRLQSGKIQQVKTAVCLYPEQNIFPSQSETSWIETTMVRFRTLSDSEIKDYIQTREPMDKAGAYGIQGLGGNLVAAIRGSYSNVIGLPIEAVSERLIGIFQLHPTLPIETFPRWSGVYE